MTRGLSPSTFKTERKRTGAFRCERCDGIYPRSKRVRQDGYWICTINCRRTVGRDDATAATAAATRAARASGKVTHDHPVKSSFAGVSIARAFEPATVTLPASGGQAEFTVKGYRLGDVVFTADEPVTIEALAISSDGREATLRATTTLTTAMNAHLYVSNRDGVFRRDFFIIR